jgi:FkbH-like protein
MDEQVKCVIWDLDNVMWSGILLENKKVKLRRSVIRTIIKLDSLGILNSVSSKNDPETAMKQLKIFNIDKYFVCPHIGWGLKSVSIQSISKKLNININSFVFIDDDPAEIEEVRTAFPQVTCLLPNAFRAYIKSSKRFPKQVTTTAKTRRLMYQQDIQRNDIIQEFGNDYQSYLKKLDMQMNVYYAQRKHLDRIHELTVRTHQLNSTGNTYTKKQLQQLLTDKTHKVVICSLEDKYGNYGEVGLGIINTEPSRWTIKLILMSCRILNKGLGSILLFLFKQMGYKENVELFIEYKENDVNRPTQMAIIFAGFKKAVNTGEENTKPPKQLYKADYTVPFETPDYIKIINNL